MHRALLLLMALALVAAAPGAMAEPDLDDVDCLPGCVEETAEQTLDALRDEGGCRPFCDE